MEAIKNFFSDFIKSFRGNAYISSYSGGQAAGEFFKLFFAPFYLTMILGFVILAAGEKWDGILLNAIEEFMQMTGIKLSFYSVIGLIAFSFLFYELRWLTQVLSWLVKSLSHAAFIMCAVLTGVLWGIVLPGCIDADNLSPLYATLGLSLLLIPLSVGFFFSAKVFCTGVREEIDNTLGKHTRKFTFGVGLVLMVLFIKTMFFDESWKEVMIEPQCQEALTKP
ncbi:hypothetical protein [Salinivibrio kushneri]|uniref:hypothetical protein n=1 Tax=Salinivibrio kushneri TaxID=1908198 RepID=UPI00098529FC|nr:hypothetical protein [Salinivibrio kushneri]OOE57906.1 hypothetical protein BZG18_15570 [Salinivibrio kushneri]